MSEIGLMASDLKWRTGFDWRSVLLLALSLLAAWLLGNPWRWAALAVAALVGLFMLAQYRKWNAKGWSSLHYRAMLLWARLSALESRRAEAEERSFDQVAACRELALQMCGPGKEVNIEAMLACLQEEQGDYLASLLERHAQELLPDVEDDSLHVILRELRKAVFGPELVICNVVENTDGGLEAAKYVLALAEGKAV